MAIAEQPTNTTDTQSEISTASTKFIDRVCRQFTAELGQQLQLSPLHKSLAQHLFLKVNASIIELEKKRAMSTNKRDQPEITWRNINMEKLAIDAVHRVALGLDALIPNHIHVVPYLNGRTKRYDIDLRIGYVGTDLIHRKHALEEPLNVVYELVYDSDHFIPHLKDVTTEIESYEFRITNPFNRGKVIGGFGYIAYDDPRKNKLILVTTRDFDRAKAAAGQNDFWTKHELEMQYKTIVHRVTSKIPLDPEKVNSVSWQQVTIESTMDSAEMAIDAEIATNANGQTLSLNSGEIPIADVVDLSSEPEPVVVEALTEDPGY